MKNEWTKKLKNLEHRVPPLISKQFIAALFVFSCLGVFVLGWALSFKIEALESIEKEVVYVERLAKSKVKELAVTEKKVVADDYIETIISQLYFLSEDFKKLSTLCMHIPSKNLFAGIHEREFLFFLRGNTPRRFHGRDLILSLNTATISHYHDIR